MCVVRAVCWGAWQSSTMGCAPYPGTAHEKPRDTCLGSAYGDSFDCSVCWQAASAACAVSNWAGWVLNGASAVAQPWSFCRA